MPPNKQTLKELFIDDPETLRVLELREQTDLLRQLADKKMSFDGVETIKGEKGETGDVGIQGEQGIQGEKGEDGQDGNDGIDGEDGKDGKDGRDGKDGESFTLKQAKTLLSSLLKDLEAEDIGAITKEDAEKIAKKHVIGSSNTLKQEIASLRGYVERNYGGHGGSGGGSTLSMEIPSGTVDGMNTVFTVVHDPFYIEVSGQVMFDITQDPSNYGYTVTGSYTITFVNPPTQTPHSFYNG